MQNESLAVRGQSEEHREAPAGGTSASRSIAWYHPGQSRVVEVGGHRITVGLVERRGRQARIAITAPAGAVFRDSHPGDSDRSPESSSRRALDATSDNRAIAK